MRKPEGKYYGYRGSAPAVGMLLFHSAFLCLAGIFLYLSRVHLPLWISAFLVLLWVPMSLVQMGRELRDPELPLSVKKAIGRRVVLLGLLCTPYLGPGLLFSYWISDTGFRSVGGDLLQRHTVEFLNSQASFTLPKYQEFGLVIPGRVRFEDLPVSMREDIMVRPRMIFVEGKTPKERHLSLLYASLLGIRPEAELMIGGPDFVPPADRFQDRTRRMWPGVYCIDVDEW